MRIRNSVPIVSIVALFIGLSVDKTFATTVYPVNPFLYINQEAVEYYNVSTVINGIKLNSSELTGMSVTELFEMIGLPQKKSGWIEYVDCVKTYSSRLFSPTYANLEIPIKAYAWDTDKDIFVCLCTFGDIRFQAFPMNASDSYGINHLGTEWLGRHSTDESFKILVCFRLNSYNEASKLAHLDVPEWIDYHYVNPISIYNFYITRFELQKSWVKKKNPIYRCSVKRQERHYSIMGLIGQSPETVTQVIQGVKTTQIIYKDSASVETQMSTWMIDDSLPQIYAIDRYDIKFKNTKCNEGYLDVVYWDNKVQLIVYHLYEPILIEYAYVKGSVSSSVSDLRASGRWPSGAFPYAPA